ncbi:transcription-repair coupling factor [Serratia symbiotica str. 'Cinara cedri']|nr:transcription-repair coupling factor [Serratia symbiotica str. 'Cinara cedri']
MSIPNSCDSSLFRSYSLPERAGDLQRLGQLFGSSCSVECADIIERHNGPVILITTDMHNTLRLRDEIRQFTNQEVSILPGWETLPYDNFSPPQDLISARLSRLYHLPTMASGVMILPISTVMQRVCPYEFLYDYTLVLKKGQYISLYKVCKKLEHIGYRNVTQVMMHGDLAIRGSSLDLYPIDSEKPYRIDLFNDKINSLSPFDINNQSVLSEVNTINLLPVHEFLNDKNTIELFCRQWRKHFNTKRDPKHIYDQVSKGIWPAGIEYWQPLFFKQPLPSLFSYLPAKTLIVNTGNLEYVATCFWQSINERYQSHYIDLRLPIMPPDTLWLCVDMLFRELKAWPRVVLETTELPILKNNTNLGYYALPELVIQSQKKLPLDNLNRFTTDFNGSVIFSVESEGRREILQDMLDNIKLNTSLIEHLDQAQPKGRYMMVGACKQGFLDNVRNRALICESDLLGKKIKRRNQDNQYFINTDTLIHNLEILHPNQLVVHLEHGIGRYAGLTTIVAGGVKAEYLIISYSGEDKLYVPVSSLHLISLYAGGTDKNVPLHKLGSDSWKRTKQKAAMQVRDVAAELLDIYAQRAAKTGFSFNHNQEQYQLFCQSFPFETTPDQQQAINAVLNDMRRPLAMDRLICGDVGFGKTEVAMRAAFVAVKNNKQVAVLVPTTLLAQQHFDNFRERFTSWSLRIEMMSRFRSAKEQQQILHAAATGEVDIIIGTHKLLQRTLRWKDLGLLIIDEEHRFGVQHKERIKAIRSDIDILTLTATPIPRTLNMAISGIRDFSIIATPPARRLAVKTFVCEYDRLMVREAILREVLRGGLVYYLYNNVDSIETTAQKLASLVPEARIIIGHGQMRERDLERVMNDFHHQRFNVLVCTTIIETGIDIANANTIIIERADRFGLAQLQQLRGRVGRSYRQAYAYLLTPNPKAISSDAHKRLTAIASIEDLGAGFALATHDLEIRGAGELLGEDQSGQMTAIGFSLYMELLECAVDALKNGREPSLEALTNSRAEVELRIPTLLPDDFVPDVNARLSFYKRIASAKNSTDLERLEMALIDRFGSLPEPASNLLQSAFLRLNAQTLGIKRIESNESGGYIEFSSNNCVDPNYLINLLQKQPLLYCLDGYSKFKFKLDLSNQAKRLQFIKKLINTFLAHRLIQST